MRKVNFSGTTMRSLRAGDWLTCERGRRIAFVCLLLSLASLGLLIATAKGTIDWRGRPIGTDFSEVYAAGRMANDGAAAKVWSWPAHFQVQQALHHSTAVDVYGWHYPPPFLLVATLLALLPYLVALFVWQAATLVPFTLLMRSIVGRRDTWLYVLGAPVTLICVTHGQNGFLTGLLLGTGLVLLDRRPFWAGLALGCLVYTPQFALVLPVVVVCMRGWRVVAGAILSALTLISVTLVLWGVAVWRAFFESLPLTRHVIIEQGRTGWFKIMSPFSAVRALHGDLIVAYAVQTTFALAAMALAAWLSRYARPNVRNACVSAAVLTSTPYVLDYDFVILGLGIGWLWRDGEDHGFGPYERTTLAFVWAAPLFTRSVAEYTLLPLGLLSSLAVLAISVCRVLGTRLAANGQVKVEKRARVALAIGSRQRRAR